MKKYLLIALAALGLAACAEKMDDNSPVQKGELEESYIAINLMAADVDTRAVTDDIGKADEYGYEEGTIAERAINSAYFFFFDAEGNAFNVTGNPASAPGGEKNYLQLTIGATTGQTENVSDIKEAVVVLSTYKGVYPSQIVAVINWTPAVGKNTYSLEELRGVMANSIGNDTDGYVMSNSVYMDGAGNVVDAVPLTAANIKTTPEAAKAAPVDIYVERTAAKVVLTASKKIGEVQNMILFDTQKNSNPVEEQSGSLSALGEIDVYVQLHGWELYNDYSTSTLLKNINTSWDVTTLGLTWNDIPYFRCYWAQSQATSQSDAFAWNYTNADKETNGFQTIYGFNVGASANYSDRTTYTYCGENTNQKVDATDPRTKVILKGQLMKKNGENYEPLELARWYGTEYAGNEALRIAVANSLKYTLYYYDDVNKKHVSIHPDHLVCVEGTKVNNAKVYEVGFQLTTDAAKLRWFQYSSETGYVEFGNNTIPGDNAVEANKYLKDVEPALLYASGQTYYIVDIKHLGAAGKTAEYGVVRNHVYQIDINSIKGYGTPVYIGTSSIVTPPEYPEDEESSYVAARINVLSWKVVKQGVDIVQ